MDQAPDLEPFAPASPVCFISTHLDDVALSCSHFLASHPGASVITVFAGAPPEQRVDGWNAKTTGELYAPDALQARRAEDASALAVVDASPYWLDLWESEYLARARSSHRGRGPALASKVARFAVSKARARARAWSTHSQRPIVDGIRRALAEIAPASVVGPLGLYHADHRTVSAACLRLARDSPFDWYLYLDMPYAQSFPRKVTRRLSRVAASSELEPLASVPSFGATKRRVVETYRSQLEPVKQGLATLEPALEDPERYWRIRRRSASSSPGTP